MIKLTQKDKYDEDKYLCSCSLYQILYTSNLIFSFRASYENSKLKGPLKACAGNNGTQITVEDLFYNVIARKKSLRSPNEEYTHIMDVVGGYAIHNSNVAFTLKKFGEKTDLKTPMNSSVIENVRIVSRYENNNL